MKPMHMHPDNALEALLSESSSETRRGRLRALHELLREHQRTGSQDFGIPTVGKLCDERELLSGQNLYNAPYIAFRKLIEAWGHYAESQVERHVARAEDDNAVPHPDSVLRSLLAKGSMANKQRNLRDVHDICKRHHATGAIDFSLKTIGKLCDENGSISGRSLRSKDLQDFRTLIESWSAFARPWLTPDQAEKEGQTRRQMQHDIALSWVEHDYPQFDAWRKLAVEWLAGEATGLNRKLFALRSFFVEYLAAQSLPIDPGVFFARSTELPNFYATACPQTKAGVGYNNSLHGFLEWVLARDYSVFADDGAQVISPAFRNPVLEMTASGTYVPSESVYSPLPYGYIDELRQLLASGHHFRDWTFAQGALGVALGMKGAPGRDWFEVSEGDVDRNDPDCVLRVRTRDDVEVLQMWSPVRWVALLVKLLLPLRTAQVRMLDSGEADTWRLDKGNWVHNTHRLAAHAGRNPLQQGVLRRMPDPLGGPETSTVLYVNTNKTADIAKDGPNKGYVMPWFTAAETHQNVFYWLEKLRNWQEKYNPISKRTPRSALDARHRGVQSAQQLSGYPDVCFLFRLAEGKKERHLPVTDGIMSIAWGNLLREFQSVLATRGEAHSGGSPIKLVEEDDGGRLQPYFPLHSLRVSLVTALALDGEVPFAILQKLVGHSRLLMTLYYTKPGAIRINSVLQAAATRLNETKAESINEFLLTADHDRLVKSAVCNSSSSLALAVPEHPAARNAAGWMPMHHGLCLVGGNTSEVEDNKKIGGCYNGGANLGSDSHPSYAAVPGGSRNCVRCRWFVTEPHHLPSLAAHFNTLAYHFDEARNKSLASEQELQTLKRRKAAEEAQGRPFRDQPALRQAERVREAAMKRFSDLAEDLVACWRLIERCKAALEAPTGGMQLMAQGAADQVQVVFEETESELLQLSGVCDSLEVYPDLEAGKAVLRRSQLLDSALYQEGLQPVFMRLSEQEQLLAGNAFMQRLARQVNPSDPLLGQRRVIELIDAGKSLSEHLGLQLGDLLGSPELHTPRTVNIPLVRALDEIQT